MLLKDATNDLPAALLAFFAKSLPPEERFWAEAMRSELAAIPDCRRRWFWALSGSYGLGRIWMRSLLRQPHREDGLRPPAVTLIALYHALFSCVLVGVLLWQLPHITEPWKEAWLPLLFAFFVALIPGAIAVGLWVLDDAARFMAMFFSLVHALANYAFLLKLHAGWRPFTAGRIALDLVMIVCLLLPSIKRSFRPPLLELRLDQKPLAANSNV